MPEITKLAIGDDVTFHVTVVEEVTTGKWPDYVLHAATGESYSAPKQALDRQFAKLKVTPASIAGHVVRLERAPNTEDATRSWWNLAIKGQADLKAAVPSKRLTIPAKDSEPVITPQSLKDDPQGRGEAWEPPEEGPHADAETEREAIEQRKHAARQAAAKRYLALWDVVAAHQVAKGKELDMPVDGMSVNAATATLWIYFGNKGML